MYYTRCGVVAAIIFAITTIQVYLYAERDEGSYVRDTEKALYKSGQTGHPSFPVCLKVSGFVKGEGIYDTRQNYTLRDGQYLYFPLQQLPDVNGADINARGTFDEYAIQSRIRLQGDGIDVGCMDSRFVIEADFFGRTDVTISSFALRLAYLELASEHFDFIAGQDWHPITTPTEFPATISFNEGVPFIPFCLTPQFRVKYHDEHIEITGSAIGFVGDRPFGPNPIGDVSFRDAMMPDLNLLVLLKKDEDNYIGADFDVMRIVPRLVTDNNYKEVNPFTAFSATFFTALHYENFLWYNEMAYAENGAIWEMLGGYAVHTLDSATDIRTYVPLRAISYGTELSWQGTIEPAIFFGYEKNLGASKTIIPNFGPDAESGIFSLGPNINTLVRVSPRLRVYIHSFVLGAEIEYTRATYGIINNYGRVYDAVPVGNTRFLFATYYIF